MDADASASLTALCVVRTEDGRWLAGRRAGWVSTWASRWALGAGGAVDLGESPAETLPRELQRGVAARGRTRLSVEALVRLPNGMAMVVGLATVADPSRAGARRRARRVGVVGPRSGPLARHADDRVRLMGRLLASALRR